MNERIRLLAEQAVYYDEDEESWEFDRKKFAELIVKECVDICNNANGASYLNGVYAGRKIREHFGVEQ